MRRPLGILLCLLAALPLGSVLAPAAHAAGPLNVRWAHSVEDDLGVLRVSAESSSDITRLTAHFVSYVTGVEAGVTSDFVLVEGTADDGVWATPEPVQLAELGYYRVDVEAEDAAGDEVFRQDAGNLAYAVRAVFEPLTVDRHSVDYQNRDVAVSGRLTGRWPDTRELRPLEGYPVTVGRYGHGEVVTTGADGRFTGTVRVEERDAAVQAVFHTGDGPMPYVQYGESEQVPIAIDASPTRLNLGTSATRVNAGETITITGRLQWQNAAGNWRSMAGETVGLLFEFDHGGFTIIDYPTTAADGRFSATYTAYTSGFVQAGFSSYYDVFKADVIERRSLLVVQPSEFLRFSATRDGNEVDVTGSIDFPGSSTPYPILVDIEYSRTGDRNWRRMATVVADWTGDGNGFTGSVPLTAGGYWRAHFHNRTDYAPAISEIVYVPSNTTSGPV